MKQKNAYISVLLVTIFCSFNTPKQTVKLPYKDASIPIEKRVSDLLGRMTTAEKIPAIVESWFLGETGGLAIADVLLGKVNPSGKLPMTFPRSVGQLPFYYNHKPTSKHIYVDQDTSALFPFGHGLSYTSFEYSNLKIAQPQIPLNGSANVSFTIKNVGKVEGEEVVQLYLRDVIASVTTPVKSLKGFKRISLKPGESGTVQFKIDNKELMLWNRQMKQVVEPGEFKVMVGSSSEDIRLRGSFYVK